MTGTLRAADLPAFFARAAEEGWTGILELDGRRHVLVDGAPLRAEALRAPEGEAAWSFEARPALHGRVDPRLAQGFRALALSRLDEPAAEAPEPEDGLAELSDVETEFARRAGRDFYGFLGLDREASPEAIEQRALQLETHFARLRDELEGEQATMASRLVLGARITRARLLDPGFRTSYDAALAQGQGIRL